MGEEDNDRILILDVLGRINKKLNIHSSSLLYLEFGFTESEIDELNQFMMTQMIADHTVTTKALGRVIEATKPELGGEQAQSFAVRLMRAWLEEGMFKGVMD
ncbi:MULTISPECIES: hypothetical protein [Lacticaseibacillus]|jgi:hypothetical protein|uniref:Uncharacterized protein n=2 Tax=Lacticaseibacillus manihotivorans TaxID=88233 RepID=A0A0R1QN15_9LACO|nr:MULTISPECIES: hypothetical protein [Lacticaseibacillus]KRL42515.1 hypothetical protein FD01_GL001907 [Lacticaseibacillus manihotivorans DSM 13343 = JCM 12514]QFQ92339.1 hypothetical protein LM010_13335 [Lacticaseibacillus manihotivorans]